MEPFNKLQIWHLIKCVSYKIFVAVVPLPILLSPTPSLVFLLPTSRWLVPLHPLPYTSSPYTLHFSSSHSPTYSLLQFRLVHLVSRDRRCGSSMCFIFKALSCSLQRESVDDPYSFRPHTHKQTKFCHVHDLSILCGQIETVRLRFGLQVGPKWKRLKEIGVCGRSFKCSTRPHETTGEV